MKRRLPIYCFNWPSSVGGADTKFVHLLLLLHRNYDITVAALWRAAGHDRNRAAAALAKRTVSNQGLVSPNATASAPFKAFGQ